MPDAYLTIDDSPSKDTDRLVDFLVMRGVPAVLYARGEFMETLEGFERIVRAIDKGFLIGNHSYGHERTSVVGFDEQSWRILKTQDLIDKAYAASRQKQPAKTIRFPHMDRGSGAWIVDFDKAPEEYRDYLKKLFWEGLNVESLEKPGPEKWQLKDKMQGWLKAQGFEALRTPGITHPWFIQSEMSEAVDAMYSFSTSDWMVTPRHAGKQKYKSLDDLKQKIDDDIWLQKENSTHIILAHDDREDCFNVTTGLIDHMLDTGFEFLPFT